MEQGTGTISPQNLMEKLVRAKKVMSKVDTGTYEKGNVNEEILRSDPEDVAKKTNLPSPSATKPVGVANVDRINQSKLPDAIKKAMIENPIPQISLNDGIDMDLVKGAKKLMEREGMITKKPSQKQQQLNENYGNYNNNDIISALTPIIENTIRKVLDEKLNQILTAQQTGSINENLVLKVGDSIFKGRITGVNKAK